MGKEITKDVLKPKLFSYDNNIIMKNTMMMLLYWKNEKEKIPDYIVCPDYIYYNIFFEMSVLFPSIEIEMNNSFNGIILG